MNSLIEVAEKKFEAKLLSTNKTRLAMKVFKNYLFKRVISFNTEIPPNEAVMKYIEETTSQMDNSQSEEASIFANVLSTFYFENALNPVVTPEIFIKLIAKALSLKMNNEVK